VEYLKSAATSKAKAVATTFSITTLSIMTFSIMTFNIKVLIATLSINDSNCNTLPIC
jgi:hypothetical protein